MLAETRDEEQVIARVAALDIGKAELGAACGYQMRTSQAGGCRRWRRTPR